MNIGSVPLRQLVYRVLALPPSMQPLVYDFGQLTDNTEKDYTIQIVTDRVSNVVILACFYINPERCIKVLECVKYSIKCIKGPAMT